ncbi:MAG: hypothetical protein EA365_00560 [Gloeocapsa sp. DLM2.Bin57]|nr:MAG: hypothetical protein EA365_00560 [Gloeocapsa sp. DLM2.Bin57]
MNAIIPRFFKVAYRKEPLSSFILVIGAVDAVIGGVGQRWTLLSLGVFTVFIAMLVRWLQQQQAQAIVPQRVNRKMLPPSAADNPLPALTNRQKQR